MSGQRIFTTWFTSTADALAHAVTDEEFMAHRPEPEAVCGRVVVHGPLVWPPGACCPRCIAFLRAHTSLQALDLRESHRHKQGGVTLVLYFRNMIARSR